MSVVRARFLGLVVANVLVLGAAPALAQEAATRVQVNLIESGCEPSAISVPAGPITFEVVNLGGEVGEFEILRGDFVVDEVENIVPAFQSNLVTRLDGGEYTTVCYTLQSPRGILSVTGGPAGTRPPSAVVDAATLAAYQAEYETYVRAQGAQFATDVAGFVAAITAGDLDTARALYAPSRLGWESIEPIAELFTELDQAIDFRVDDYESADDPNFKGYHRIERILWVEGASGDLNALATELLGNANELATKLTTLPIDAYTMAQGAGALIEEVAQTKMTGEEDRYSGTDLWSIQANVDGSSKIVDILRPSLAQIDAGYLDRLDAAFASVNALTDRYRDGEGFQSFSAITADDLTALQSALAGLTEVLSQLAGTLGLRA